MTAREVGFSSEVESKPREKKKTGEIDRKLEVLGETYWPSTLISVNRREKKKNPSTRDKTRGEK